MKDTVAVTKDAYSFNLTNDGTVDNPQTGVNTYFVVLGIVAIISYSFMLLTKKFNLFKKI